MISRMSYLHRLGSAFTAAVACRGRRTRHRRHRLCCWRGAPSPASRSSAASRGSMARAWERVTKHRRKFEGDSSAGAPLAAAIALMSEAECEFNDAATHSSGRLVLHALPLRHAARRPQRDGKSSACCPICC